MAKIALASGAVMRKFGPIAARWCETQVAALRTGCKRFLVLCALLLMGWTAGAADSHGAAAGVSRWSGLADTVFRRFTSTEMRFADAMTQDGDGFLWLATQDGLVRWDGYHSRIYHADPQDQASLPGNWVTCLHTDQRGHLWVGTAVGGLARYDSERDTFEIVGGGPGGLRSPNVTVIAADGSTGLWIGTGDGLDHIDLETRLVRGVFTETCQK